MLEDAECLIHISANLHASIEAGVSIHNFLLHGFYSSKIIFNMFLSEGIFLLSVLLTALLKTIKTNHEK
jgi:hypothetical protein